MRRTQRSEDRKSFLSSLSLLQGSGLSSPQQLEGSFQNSGLRNLCVSSRDPKEADTHLDATHVASHPPPCSYGCPPPLSPSGPHLRHERRGRIDPTCSALPHCCTVLQRCPLSASGGQLLLLNESCTDLSTKLSKEQPGIYSSFCFYFSHLLARS